MHPGDCTDGACLLCLPACLPACCAPVSCSCNARLSLAARWSRHPIPRPAVARLNPTRLQLWHLQRGGGQGAALPPCWRRHRLHPVSWVLACWGPEAGLALGGQRKSPVALAGACLRVHGMPRLHCRCSSASPLYCRLPLRSFKPEISHGCNSGLASALTLITPVKEAFPELGWADLMQLASAVAIEVGGWGGLRQARHGRWHAAWYMREVASTQQAAWLPGLCLKGACRWPAMRRCRTAGWVCCTG